MTGILGILPSRCIVDLHVYMCASPYQSSDVGIGLLVQQELGDSVVAAVSRDVQRCEVVQCDVIDRGLVLQQELQALDVVSLGRHVQRRQSVLCEADSDGSIRGVKRLAAKGGEKRRQNI